MKITRVAFSGYKGFTFDLKFEPTENLMVGPNGCGKTTVLEIIAGLTGTDEASELVAGKSVEYVMLQLTDHTGQQREIFMEDWFDPAKITAFKATLRDRSSFVLRHELYDEDYVGVLRPREELVAHMLEWLEKFGLGLKKQLRWSAGRGASLLVGSTGAQRYLMEVGMRLPPQPCPILVENPERSLHIMLQSHVINYYALPGQQTISAGYSPECLTGFERRNTGWDYNQRGGVDYPYKGLLSLDNRNLHKRLELDVFGKWK